MASDLHDSLVKQSPASDIYAFGHLMCYIYNNIKLTKEIKALVKLCSSYNSAERPSCEDIIEILLSSLSGGNFNNN